MAAIIAGLITAADMAEHAGDQPSAERYRQAADRYEARIEQYTFTTTGKHNHNGRYYLRISQNTDPNDNGSLQDRNGRGELREQDVIDGGFPELVRYGVRSADNRWRRHGPHPAWTRMAVFYRRARALRIGQRAIA